jgi:murein DD-endopeptidase MepM/ murein hydrolase activator NlpD
MKKYNIDPLGRDKPARLNAPPPWLVTGIFILLLAALILGIDRLRKAGKPASSEPAPAAVTPNEDARPQAQVPALRGMALPTPQQNLFEPGWQQGVQPTVSGRPESGLYGSVRTGSKGLASFHEGVDIAVVSRDSRGNPTDPVTAVAPGRVAYVSRTAGNSNYGLYVILFHDDPAGEVCTLYAHMAAIDPAIQPGMTVERGTRLGTVGHTSSSPIPRDRAHLHLEVGLIANDQFAQWVLKEGSKNPHGRYNGRNLLGVDPLGVLAQSARDPGFSLLAHLQSLPVAFRVAVKSKGRMPDFFKRHPALWRDPAGAGPVIVLDCSEGGVPLSGRNATAGETAAIGSASAVVLQVSDAALGRNGRHLVVKRGSEWQIGRNGEEWLSLLLF